MKGILKLAALPILPLLAGPAVAAAPRVPTAGWVVDFAESRCIASRDYGSAGEPLVLAFKPSPMGNVMQIALLIKPKSLSEPRQVPVEIGIDGRPPIATSLLAFDVKQKRVRSIRINLPRESFAPVHNAKTLSIRARGEIDEVFSLAQMPDLTAQLDRCLADLKHYWNIDDAGRLKTRAKATRNLASYFSDDDYPAVALGKEEGGTVEFAMLIDEAGRIADCAVTATSNVPALDAQSCALLTRRVTFLPATGADGKPAKDAVTSRIRWVIP